MPDTPSSVPSASASPAPSAPARARSSRPSAGRSPTSCELGVVTNDIYTDEDARFLRSAGVLDPERIRAVETGACPHTAIRDDVTPNLLAVEDLEARLRAARRGARRVRRRQPHRDVLAGAGRRADLRARRRRRRRRRPQGRPGHRPRRPARRQQDRPRAVRRGRRAADGARTRGRVREGRPVLALSRHRPGLGGRLWRTGCVGPGRRVRAGGHTPVDPGPMAPHATSGQVTTTTRIEVTAAATAAALPLRAGPLAVRRLPSADRGSVRVALVAAGALLLAGDEVRVEVVVDGPVTVEVVETAGTVAYDMRGGSRPLGRGVRADRRGPAGLARRAVRGGRWVRSVDRSTTGRRGCRVGAGAAGDAGVRPCRARSAGALCTRTRIDLGGVPVLVEDLDLSPEGRCALDHPARAPVPRLGHHGRGAAARRPGTRSRPRLEASVARSLSDEAHRSTMVGVWSAARAALAPRIPA